LRKFLTSAYLPYVLARIRKLSDEDMGIARRLTEARESLLLSRAVVARKLAISLDRMNNYELMRSPLPFGVGYNFCYTFKVNPFWVYDGRGPKWFSGFVAVQEIAKPGPGTLFKEAFRKLDADQNGINWRSYVAQFGSEVIPSGPFVSSGDMKSAEEFEAVVLDWVARIDSGRTHDFLRHLKELGEGIVHHYRSN
jgi:hypothetical protein